MIIAYCEKHSVVETAQGNFKKRTFNYDFPELFLDFRD